MTESMITVPRRIIEAWQAYLEDESCSMFCDKTWESQGCPYGECSLEKARREVKELLENHD